MVKESYRVFDVSDIIQVALQCSHCNGEMANSIKEIEVTDACPQCGKAWEPREPSGYRGMNWELLRALKKVAEAKSLSATIRFKIDGEQAQ